MKKISFLFSLLFFAAFLQAQVGVNATVIDPSAALDIRSGSTPKGLLTPRVTTVERTAITSPADGLILYDTNLKSFFHYNAGTASWVRLNSEANGRLNFKRIKSTDNLATVLKDELAIGGGSKYVLNTNTLYEINGTVTLNFPIELNNAYIQGQDSGEDKLVSAGTVFSGTKGGTVKGLTLSSTGGKVFDITAANTESLIFRDAIVASSANVGNLSGFNMVFISIVQYASNTTGITYSNINRLFLSNLGWFATNAGTYETYTGTFMTIQKQGGFMGVNTGAVGIDVSSNPTINGDAIMEGIAFTGTSTTYVKGYTQNTYPGYTFTKDWHVICTGIPNETDDDAVGEFTADYELNTGGVTSFAGLPTTSIIKVVGPTVTENRLRFTTKQTPNGTDIPNYLKYEGKRKRYFQITGAISFQVSKANTYIIYIAKNNTVINKFKVYGRSSVDLGFVSVPLNAMLEMSNGDFIEVFVQRTTNSSTLPQNQSGVDQIITTNLTLIIN